MDYPLIYPKFEAEITRMVSLQPPGDSFLKINFDVAVRDFFSLSAATTCRDSKWNFLFE